MSDRFTIHNQDCIAGMAEHLAPDSVHLCITSIPFGALFMYSGKQEDIGNNHDGVDMRASQFGLHMRFAIEQLYRVMEPGAVVCIHIQQLITTKVQHGHMGRRDLRGATVDLFGAGGFDWTGEFCIPKNPQAMAQRMKLHSLLFITGKRDARALAPAMNDYVLVFRKPGEGGTPVPAIRDVPRVGRRATNADELHDENLAELVRELGSIDAVNAALAAAADAPLPEPIPTNGGWLTTDEWIRDARGLWSDIRETDVLTGWRDAREDDDEKHVCPLQLEVIRRLIRLYSNPDALVLDPFMGIGSTAVVALEQARRAVGFELKESYFRQSIANCELELRRQAQENTLPLFEMAGVGVPA